MKSRTAFKLFLYFSAALLLFAAINCAVFIALFRARMIAQSKTDMEARAVSIASALSNFVSVTRSSGGVYGRLGKVLGSGYGTYLKFIDDIAMSDVWIVDEDLNLIMNRKIGGKEYNYGDLPADADKVVGEVFKGKTTFSEGFSSLMETPTLTVGTPITVGGNVVGAILLHSPVEGLDDATAQGVRISAVSLAAALIISALLAAFLALSFTRPLSRMKKTALRLADGDYTAKTGINQKDEAGELANIIDTLGGRLQAAKAESDNLENMRRDFITNISHELKTPVTVIRGSLEALCDGVVTDPEQVNDYHKQMLSESVSLQRLVSDLLELSRLQNADFRIETEKINLCDILGDAVRSAARLGQDKGIDIIQDYDVRVFEVIGDYGRLRQMFIIILDNAVKFSPAGGVIRVSLKNGLVSIEDNGRGISEAELPHIFDRFYKTKSEENKTGSGLGLAIAKQIADRHKIDVSVISKAGKGTTFMLKFH